MNSTLLAVIAAFIAIISSSFAARADEACTSELKEIKNGCAASVQFLKESEKTYTDASRALNDKNRVAIENARNTLKDGVKELERSGSKDTPVGASGECTKKVNACLETCAKKELCTSPGEDKERLDAIDRLQKLDQELGKTEGDATAGGKGDGKGDKDKKGGGGGMPEMPKPPEDQKKENADRSCGGSTPDPACPPKDDVCFKDPNSVACLCQAGLGTADVCKRAQVASERDRGGGSGDDVGGGGGGGGKSATYLDENGANEMSNGRARAGSYGGGGGGGGRGGGGVGLGGGGASSSGLPEKLALPARLADSPTGGSGGGGGGGGSSRSSSSGKSAKPYERMLARGMAIAQRRLAGGAESEIGARHGNLFENVSRAYRAHAGALKK